MKIADTDIDRSVMLLTFKFYPPAREASKEIPNLTERKNPHTRIKPLLN